MGRSLWPCVSGWLAVMTLMGWLFASCDNEETCVPALHFRNHRKGSASYEETEACPRPCLTASIL